MSVRFPYRLMRAKNAVWSLGGRWVRPRPIFMATLIGPAGAYPRLSLLDTAADDTVFPQQAAVQAGIDLTNAPSGEAGAVGGVTVPVRYAEVTLRITDGREFHEWTARVGFTAARLIQPLLGFAGFLQFFSANFLGDGEEVELTVNSLYTGT